MATFFKLSPKNYLSDFGEFEDWAAGTTSAPSGWTAATTPRIAQEASNIKFGLYSARILGTNAAALLAGIYRTIPDGADYAGRTFKLGVWAKSASTGPYIELWDGVASKTVHSGGTNAFEFLTTPGMKLDYNATELRINLFATTNSTVYFDSAVLCEGEDLLTEFTGNLLVSDFSPSLTMRMDTHQVTQKEGSFIADNHIQSKSFRMKGSVVGSDTASTRTHFDQLMRSLVSLRTQEEKNIYIQDDRMMDGFIGAVEHDFKKGANMITFSANIVVPDGSSRFFNKFRKRQVIAATITEFNVPYGGSAQSKPVISFIANQAVAIGTCQLENLTTGESIIIIGTVPDGAALDIDSNLGTCFNSGINAISQFGTSDFISLVSGTNYFRFSGSNCQINIDWFDRYL